MYHDKKVSVAVIKRIPRYYRYLYDLLKMDITRISSKELSARMGITASQIRQDLNCFGGFGQQGYGYNVEALFNEIGKILGLHNNYQTIIIGAGNMGHALANYENFEKRGFKLVGIFDMNPRLIGKKMKNLEVMSMDRLDDFVVQTKVDIAIISVPYEQTPVVADRAARLGIKALWNFSPMDLKLPYDIVIENVHLSDSLMVLGYKLNQIYNNGFSGLSDLDEE
ncbi:MAG: redox-sensing transcriptional repressor Rex [Clostridiales bacterium]|nr:redox-sensing transcriptional repressor Rex [Clostridiales bacterium]